MRIRSITYFIDPGWPLDMAAMLTAGSFLNAARTTLTDAGFEVQTVRMATRPFPEIVPSLEEGELVDFARAIEAACAEQGIQYAALGPADPRRPESYRAIPAMLAATQNVFASGHMGMDGGVYLEAVRACADVIVRSAPVTPDGFTNLRFTALANVRACTPFFPAAYHCSSEPAFAIATESADLAVSAFEEAGTLAGARENLIEALESSANRLETACQELSLKYGIMFQGIDFTLAPFPEEQRSLGTALERLGVPAVGLSGSLAASAFIADTLDRARFHRTGFCGLMLPVLEDSTLALRAAEQTLTINDLLLYSAVCGTGLDTIPLAGDVSTEQISALLLDMAALAYRLDKPLTARLMPIPGKKAGEEIHFDFPFFADSRVMDLPAMPLGGVLAGGERLWLSPRWRVNREQ